MQQLHFDCDLRSNLLQELPLFHYIYVKLGKGNCSICLLIMINDDGLIRKN